MCNATPDAVPDPAGAMTRDGVIAYLRQLQASGTLTLSVEGAGVAERMSITNAHVVLIGRMELAFVISLLESP